MSLKAYLLWLSFQMTQTDDAAQGGTCTLFLSVTSHGLASTQVQCWCNGAILLQSDLSESRCTKRSKGCINCTKFYCSVPPHRKEVFCPKNPYHVNALTCQCKSQFKQPLSRSLGSSQLPPSLQNIPSRAYARDEI